MSRSFLAVSQNQRVNPIPTQSQSNVIDMIGYEKPMNPMQLDNKSGLMSKLGFQKAPIRTSKESSMSTEDSQHWNVIVLSMVIVALLLATGGVILYWQLA